MTLRNVIPALLACSLAACATSGADTAANTVRPASDTVRGAQATSAAGAKAIGAYGALGTSDDVRGRSSSSGASTLTGRASMAGSDSGTSADATTDDTAPPPR